jgi:hypothetical protein
VSYFEVLAVWKAHSVDERTPKFWLWVTTGLIVASKIMVTTGLIVASRIIRVKPVTTIGLNFSNIDHELRHPWKRLTFELGNRSQIASAMRKA